MLRRCATLAAVSLFVGACGLDTDPPPPAAPRPSAPRPEATPTPDPWHTLSIDLSASWLALSVANRDDAARPELPVTRGAVTLWAPPTAEERPAVVRVDLVLADVDIGPELLPPEGVHLVAPRISLVAEQDGCADLRVVWGFETADGEVRALRPIEVSCVPFTPVITRGPDGYAVSIDGEAAGPLWRLDGLFEMSDLAYGLVAR